MILELIENSCKFSTTGSSIEARGEVIKDRYEITIKNEGTEIDSSVLESFYQKDKNYNQQNGNGLGLSIVKMIFKNITHV
ncbi:MAG: ATP-binding protein [Ignavibacteriae bacterium]|nr:ATP-binding protein [Ignavibacteriota bacterium]